MHFLTQKRKGLHIVKKEKRKKEKDNHKEIRKWRRPNHIVWFFFSNSKQRYLSIYIYIYINKNKKPMWDEIKEKDNDNKVRKPNINQILNGNS